MNWAVPWAHAEVVNTIFLAVAAIIMALVPIIYAFRANLRDPLARAVLAGTGGASLAFVLTLAALIAYHSGWNPSLSVWSWLTRGTYLLVALGELLFLLALLRVLREHKHSQQGDGSE